MVALLKGRPLLTGGEPLLTTLATGREFLGTVSVDIMIEEEADFVICFPRPASPFLLTCLLGEATLDRTAAADTGVWPTVRDAPAPVVVLLRNLSLAEVTYRVPIGQIFS